MFYLTRNVNLLNTVAVARLQITCAQIGRKTWVPLQQLVSCHLICERNVRAIGFKTLAFVEILVAIASGNGTRSGWKQRTGVYVARIARGGWDCGIDGRKSRSWHGYCRTTTNSIAGIGLDSSNSFNAISDAEIQVCTILVDLWIEEQEVGEG